MTTFICEECCESFDAPKRPKSCPGCGPGTRILYAYDEDNPANRHRDDDDGLTYADPRDERDERRSR